METSDIKAETVTTGRPNWPAIVQMGSGGVRLLSEHDCELLYSAAVGTGAKTIVEIGAMRGTSSIVLGLAARITGGDVFSFEARPHPQWQENINAWALGSIVTLIHEASPWVSWPKPYMPGAKEIDFLFIDGDHKVTSAIADYRVFSKWLHKGSLVAFHDIYGPPSNKVNKAIELIVHDEAKRLKEIRRTPQDINCGTALLERFA